MATWAIPAPIRPAPTMPTVPTDGGTHRQTGLMASNGWRQARQKNRERHCVGPNALSMTTRPSPQYGQRTSAGSDRRRDAGRRQGGPPGGA